MMSSPSAPPPPLLERSLSALKWNYSGFALRAVFQIGMSALLARLLGPEAFGLVGAAWLVIGIANLVADLGYGSALIQRERIDAEDIRAAFTVQVSTGLLLGVAMAISAPSIAQLFSEERLRGVLWGMSAIVAIQPFGVVSSALLRRDLDFKALQVRQTASYVFAYGAFGAPAAMAGLGVWSLVGAQVLQIALNAASTYAKVRHPIKPKWPGRSDRLRRFSLRVTFTNMINWLIENADNFVVAKFADTAGLGFYSVAYNLVRTPINHLVFALQGVVLPAGAKVQREPEKLRFAWRVCLAAVSLVALPTFASVSVLAETVTEALYGPGWAPGAALLAPLALAMPLHAAVAVTGPFLWATGRVNRELGIELSVALVFVPMFVVAINASIVAVAWAVFAAYLARAALLVWVLLRTLDGRPIEVVRSIRGGVLLALGIAATVKAIDVALTLRDVSAPVRMAIELVTGAGGLLLLLFFVGGWLMSGELQQIAREAAKRAPPALQVLVLRALGALKEVA